MSFENTDETKKSPLEDISNAKQYVEFVRENYREGNAEYRGNRNEDQQLIAEIASDQARAIVDGSLLGIIALNASAGASFSPSALDRHADDPILADFSWNDFRNEFSKLLAGFGVLTNRLHRDGFQIADYADITEREQLAVGSVLFTDFLKHNALRFGVDGSGVHRTKLTTQVHEDGEIVHGAKVVDKDLAEDRRDILRNVRHRGYRNGIAQHPAGKMSPSQYMALRKQYPELDKDIFDNIISSFINAERELAERE